LRLWKRSLRRKVLRLYLKPGRSLIYGDGLIYVFATGEAVYPQ
jgi:hypothetical protein